eukprot:CAMPEP_0202339178 /NCGR_PEP_ID=MMETSP1126-20121109/1154_1 /ASSEMBLY_ACC=CAM_ASM_000457 /TAXON_ID=3047 /ORGANISM="Dunaliella tertiolecta, Strain CCMP1320" /LENGTH=99 /DNA_ID=CAMNT_0048929697 /DNA_START=1641 /DNA_END=1940 /DNA_ORIENTATION=+
MSSANASLPTASQPTASQCCKASQCLLPPNAALPPTLSPALLWRGLLQFWGPASEMRNARSEPEAHTLRSVGTHMSRTLQGRMSTECPLCFPAGWISGA